MSAQKLFELLCEPFPSEYIEWRIGSVYPEKDGKPRQASALAYLDARAVMDRLDAVCGPDGWQCSYVFGQGTSTVCNLGVRMPAGEWVWKADGAGATDVEGEKGALSDALKRAAVRFGVGRYLYEMPSVYVDVEPAGKSFKIKKSERKKMDDAHDELARKCGWGTRSNVVAYKVLNQAIKEWVTDPATALEFKEKNKSMIAQLPVAMQRHLSETLDRIGAPRDMRMAG